ncbi:hypothetical protein HYQ46_006035 [Verticillium longisporum]|nr:hypothetical protein HYQ46_006035 [Verticillium longisporum]
MCSLHSVQVKSSQATRKQLQRKTTVAQRRGLAERSSCSSSTVPGGRGTPAVTDGFRDGGSEDGDMGPLLATEAAGFFDLVVPTGRGTLLAFDVLLVLTAEVKTLGLGMSGGAVLDFNGFIGGSSSWWHQSTRQRQRDR